MGKSRIQRRGFPIYFSLGLKMMRVAVLLLVALLLSGCATHRGIPLDGATGAVSGADLDAVVAATMRSERRPERVYGLKVVGRDEVWLYPHSRSSPFYGTYYIVRRIRGVWKFEEISWTLRAMG